MSASPSFLHRPWSEPLAAAQAAADQPFALCLLSDGSPGARWSYVMARPSEVAEAPAGAGVVADSDPASERVETEAKIAAIRRALTGRDQEV